MAAIVADINKTPCGAKLFNIGFAIPRPSTITPEVAVTIRIGFFISFNNEGTHCSVYNSVTAVPHMQMNIKINNGDASALYIPAIETPEETRSVTGKSSLENRYP